MVGVPKSKGCSTCRARSVKCDEARPSCSQCRRGGRKCPGYGIRMKFIDENAAASGKIGRRKCQSTSVQSEISIQGDGTFPSHFSSAKQRSIESISTESSSRVPHLDLSESRVQNYWIPILTGLRVSIREIEQQGIIASFVQDIFPLGKSTVQLSFIGSWLWHVPQVLQKSCAMDQAAEALALAYFAKKADSKEILIRSQWMYSNALASLSKALQCPHSRFASETLCAILLFVHYENFVAMQENSWIAHAGGIGRIIQLRGPKRHRSSFEYAMFMAARGYLIIEAVATGNKCFLDDDEWRALHVDERSPLIPDNSGILHEGMNHFAIVPGLLKDFKSLKNNNKILQKDDIKLAAMNARFDMIDWYQKFASHSVKPVRTLQIVSPSQDTTLPSIYEYKDIITASFVINYSANILLLNNLIDSLTNSTYYQEDNIALSMDICLSAAYCSKAGFCGVQAMAFALPVALSTIPAPYVSWVQNQIKLFEEIKKSYKLGSTIVDGRLT